MLVVKGLVIMCEGDLQHVGSGFEKEPLRLYHVLNCLSFSI